MFKKTLALVLSAAMAATGCASAGGPRVESSPAFGADQQALLADYVRKLPAGSKVKVERTTGEPVKGILIRASDTSVVIQRHTRVPEPAVEIPLDQVTRVSLDTAGSGHGKTIGLGIAAGVGSFVAIGLIIAALAFKAGAGVDF